MGNKNQATKGKHKLEMKNILSDQREGFGEGGQKKKKKRQWLKVALF